MLIASAQLWRERYHGSWEPRNTRKSHCTTNLTHEIYWKRPRGWLPLLGWEAAKSWAGGRLCFIVFLRVGGTGVQGSPRLVIFCALILQQSQRLVGVCGLILGEAQGLVVFWAQRFMGFCGLMLCFLFCRAELGCPHLVGLEMATMSVGVVWGTGTGHSCTSRGLHW